jgi:hypothetical protein
MIYSGPEERKQVVIKKTNPIPMGVKREIMVYYDEGLAIGRPQDVGVAIVRSKNAVGVFNPPIE